MNKNHVKSFISLILCLSLLCVTFSVFGEENTWTCPECGRKNNTGNFCGFCAHPSPPPESEPVEAPTEDSSESQEEEILPSIIVLSEKCPASDAHLRNNQDEGYRVQSYTGPGKKFVSSGGYKPYKQGKIKVFFEEDGWVLTDMLYQTVEERFIYLPKYSFDSIDDIPVLSDLEYYSAKAVERIVPSWGPDNRFNAVNSLAIEIGTELKVYFQENGFVYAEYECDKGLVRMWLPADSVSIEGAVVTYSDQKISPAGQSSFK